MKKKDISKILLVVVSALLSAITLKLFIQSSGMLTGGVTGVSIIIARVVSKFTDLTMQEESVIYSVLYFVFNIPIFILGFKNVGKKFSIFSFMNAALCSLFVPLIPFSVLDLMVDIMANRLLVSIIAGILSGVAGTIAFSNGFSGGGTDIISMYISNKKRKNIAVYTFVLDAIVLLTAFIIFKDLNSLVYTIIYSFVRSVVINILYKRNKRMLIQIVTEKGDLIAESLIKNDYRTSTITKVKGAYSNEVKQQIDIVISGSELKEYLKIIKELDPSSFVIVTDVKEIYGNFILPPIE